MLVQDLMTTPVLTIHATEPLLAVQEIMRWNHIRHVPVVERDGKVIGIVSQRDLLAAAVSSLSNHLGSAERREHLAISEVVRVMKTEVITIEPTATAQQAAATMRAKLVGCLPVMENGSLVGIITDADIVQLVADLPAATLAGVPAGRPRVSQQQER